MSMFYGGVNQLGYIVKDIEAAMDHWSGKLGIGPWFYKEDTGMCEFRYYGKPSEFPKLSIALAQSGDVQIELIQQRNDAPSLYLDTLKNNGEIAQHVAFATHDHFDEYCAKFVQQGYVEGHGGRMSPNRGRFAYFVHPDLPSGMFEISETTGGKAEYFEKVRRASLHWDGSDPVRLPSSIA